MDKGKMSIVIIGVTVAILIAVFLFVTFMSINQNRPQIVLPNEDRTSDQFNSEQEEHEAELISRVDVTPATVQNVIETLNRPEAYMRTITLTTFWSGGQGSTIVESYIDGGCVRFDTVLPGGQIRHTIRNGDSTYIWYNGEKKVFSVQTGDFSEDAEQWIPTYENLLEIDRKNITQAGYVKYQDIDCIYVMTAKDVDGYSEQYWVSVDNGLLIAAERFQEETVVYRMEALATVVGIPDTEHFTLPNGTVVNG